MPTPALSRLFAAVCASTVITVASIVAQPSPPCGRCLAVIVDPERVPLLPSQLAGLEILVRTSAPASAVDKLLEVIAARGGKPGILMEALAGGELPRSSALRTILLRAPADPTDLDSLAFILKTSLTAMRARLPGHVRIGLSTSGKTLPQLLTRDLAAYVDFVVSATAPPSSVEWWREAGEISNVIPVLWQRGPDDGRSLWIVPQRGDAFVQTMSDLAAAARLLPVGLVPSTSVTVACGEKASAAWLDPATLSHVAVIESCRPEQLRIVPAHAAPEVVALATGGLLVRMAEASPERFAAGVDVSAARPLTIQEIIARHQAAAARQAAAVKSRISTGSLSLAFEAPGFPAPLTITSAVVMFMKDGLTELEQQDIRINGLTFGGGKVPRLPLIEPERVASPPLAIELTDVYRYALVGTETLRERPCYLVRFEPVAGGRTLFRGTAWIAADDFGLVKVAATQVELRGAIVSSEQVDEFTRTDGMWLLRESRVNQIYEGAAHRTPIERVLTLERTEINPPDFESRRAAAYASPHVMVRDTPEGYRYLRRDARRPEERSQAAPAPVLEEPAKRVRTLALGVIVDPNISRPLPFAGLSYVDFDLFGTGTQFNGFFGGTFGQLAFSVPSVAGSRWQVAGRAFGIASSFNDRSFVQGTERYDENIRQRPAQASVWVLRPLTPRVTLRVGYDLDYTHYTRADTTDSAFTVPPSQLVHAARVAVEAQRRGWTATAWWAPALRQRWSRWGRPVDDHYDPEHRDFQRYGVSLARSAVLTPTFVARGEAVWMGGRDLDRFSRYSFGAFDNRLRGYPGALIRYDRGAVVRGAVAWSVKPRLRLDGFADSAFVHDPGFGRGLRPFTGLGMAIEMPAPFGTLVTAEWGVGIQGRRTDGRRGTHVYRITGYKIF
jgi:hypothetical protein